MGDPEAFQKAMNLGHDAAWDQDWEHAAQYYRQALDLMPENTQALTSLALALFEMQDFEGALSAYQQASFRDPDDPIPVEKMARIYERMGRLGEAIKASLQAADLFLKAREVEKALQNWTQVLSLQPENVSARSRLAVVYEKFGRKGEAAAEYLALAGLLQRSGNASNAAQAVTRALQLAPESPEVNQAVAMLRTGQMLPPPPRPRGGTAPMRMAAARQNALAPAAADQPLLTPVAEARKRALVQIAALLFEQSETMAQNEVQAARRGIGSLTRGTGGLTMDQTDQTRTLLHLSQAIESQTNGQDAQAAAELQKAVDIGLSHPAVYFDLGMTLSGDDPQRALKYLQKAVRSPDFALAANFLLGRLYQITENLPQAVAHYLQALRLADMETVLPEEAEELSQLYETIVETQTQKTDPTELTAICETVVKQLDREDWRKFLRTARAQLPQQPAGSPAMPLAEMLLESRSGQVIEALARVRQLSDQGKIQSAMEEAFYALRFAPTYMPLHVQIGELLIKEGRVQDAVDKFMLVAQLYSLRGDAAAAIRLLARVTQMAPMDLAIRGRLIELLTAQGRVDEAIQQYVDLAEIYNSLAELDMTRQTYQSALRLTQRSSNPRKWSVEILTRVADIDMQRLDLRQAARIFEQLRTLQPEAPEPRHQLIALNFRLGQEAAALTELDGYLSLLENSSKRGEAITFVSQLRDELPDQIEIRKRLADLHIRNEDKVSAIAEMDAMADMLHGAGNRLAAITMVRAIIALHPDNVEQYQTVLDQLQNG
ncbi:MAG TPA: tetratricopeptide repeat protein [Anaerolineaceae bacterium]|jgi:tetratricopeptide (TPR) repeat protein|nr:tetratricopeptide repeat protein [Anaerolineaceae bacterium]